MTLDEIQNNALINYSDNLDFFEKNDKRLYDKIKLFESAMDLGSINPRYELEYKESYFDIYDKKENTWFYGVDSNEYSTNIVNKVNFKSKESSFRPFYGIEYEEGLAENSKKLSILSNFVYGNAPIVDYVNSNLPKEEILRAIYFYPIFGVGLGLHLDSLVKKIKAHSYCIIEPSLEIFRLSLFTINYSKIFTKIQLTFFVSENDIDFTKKFVERYRHYSFYTHYIKFFLFSKNCQVYIDKIQEALVSQRHYLYAYNRELLSIQRTYLYAKENFKYIDISKSHNLEVFDKKPVFLLGAGPSLQKNIAFLRENQDKFIVAAVFGTMPLLEKEGIIPDFIFQYDESKPNIVITLDKIKNRDFFSETIFIFSSHIYDGLLKAFPKENIYVFQSLFEAKSDYGVFTSPSIGEISYYLIQRFGANTLYLLGIDMSLDPDTGKSHYDGYISGEGIKKAKVIDSKNFNMRENIIKVKGNFQDIVDSLPLYTMSIHHINDFTQRFTSESPRELYNLSNGAYLEGVIPLKVEDLNLKTWPDINKGTFKKDIVKCFEVISSSSFSVEDKEYNKNKLSYAIALKEKLSEIHFGKKHSTSALFLTSLHNMHDNIVAQTGCVDLARVMQNYSSHTLHYIFYFFTLKSISNPKRHIKRLNKVYFEQTMKIFDFYIDILQKAEKENI